MCNQMKEAMPPPLQIHSSYVRRVLGNMDGIRYYTSKAN